MIRDFSKTNSYSVLLNLDMIFSLAGEQGMGNGNSMGYLL